MKSVAKVWGLVVVLAALGAGAALGAEAPVTNRTVSVRLPVGVTSDRAQFSYDEGAVVLTGVVRLDYAEYRFSGKVPAAEASVAADKVTFVGPVEVESSTMHVAADKVTVFIETNYLARIVSRTKKAPVAAGSDVLRAKAAAMRERMSMIDSLTAEGGVALTNTVLRGTVDAGVAAAQLHAAAAGGVPVLPLKAERDLKDRQSGACAKAVYIGSTRKVVMYGDKATGAPARLAAGAKENELEGSVITFWLDPVVTKGRAADGRTEEKLRLMPTQVDVEKSSLTVESSGLSDGGAKNKDKSGKGR